MNKIKEHLDNTLKDMKVDEKLRDEILKETVYAGVRRGERPKKRINRKFRSIGAAAAVIFFCLTTLTVLGGEIPAIQYWINQVSPGLAEFLYPVTGSCEKEGICVSVIAGVNDEHHADIYFTIRDTEGKMRTVSKADFMDSAGLDGGSVSNVEFISYDESTQTALYVLH